MDSNAYSTYWHHHHHQQPMAPDPPILNDLSAFGQPHVLQRSKTPTSLVNHTGLSPGGPLSTPPMSRDASRGPEPLPPQFPDQMVYDGSASNSPTSVRTPDNDSLEELVLDTHSLRNFYHDNRAMMPAQLSPQTLTAADDNSAFLTTQGTISDQGMHTMFPASRSY